MHRQSQIGKKTARRSARQYLPRRQRPHERNTVACGGRGFAGASFRSLANRRRTKNIRPHLMARNSRLTLDIEHPLRRHGAPLCDGLRRNTEPTCQSAGAASCFENFIKCIGMKGLFHGRG